MKTQPTITESLQRGVGFCILVVLALTIPYGLLDTAERSIAIVGLPVVALLFVLYSALKFANSRKRISDIRREAERIVADVASEPRKQKK